MDGSELSAISLDFDNSKNTDTLYSKFRKLYVLFKSDDQPQTNPLEEGIFVSYTAMKIGKGQITLDPLVIVKAETFLLD